MSFNWLPPEIQQRILLTTLQLEPRAAQRLTNLALTSKDCYAAVTRLAWKHIRVTRPSTLRLIHAALTSNSALGEPVQSIHIGPENELDGQGWPCGAATYRSNDTPLDEPMVLLEITLPESELPRWIKPGSAWNLSRTYNDCKNHLVQRAIQNALMAINVEPHRRGYSGDGHRIGIRAWAGRLWEAQAALELYLGEVRRIEEAKGYQVEPWSTPMASRPPLPPLEDFCRLGCCGHYPYLIVQAVGEPPRESDDDRFVLTREQIQAHLARPEGPSNHFDNLFLFTPSTPSGLDMGEEEWQRLREDLRGPHKSLFSNEDWKAMIEADETLAPMRWPWQDGQAEEEEEDEDEDASSDEEQWGGNAKLGGSEARIGQGEDLLSMATQVLATTTQVSNLSLTGWLPPPLPQRPTFAGAPPMS